MIEPDPDRRLHRSPAVEPVKPALSFRPLTRFYDALVGWTTNEGRFREILLDQVLATPAARVLDVGCGTGTFALALARRRPGIELVGFDGDPGALEIARRKGERVRSRVRWQRGRAQELPYADASFDVVTSSLFFHHLRPAVKGQVAREIARVLAPDGWLHVADWTTPGDLLRSAGFFAVQVLDGFATTVEHRRGLLAGRLSAAGFGDVEQTSTLDVPLGTIGFWRARRPTSGERALRSEAT